ncbi:MAG TPA: phosphoenolpyruvate kinase [Vicinamibacteria bacterium]|nr:phosphoenolpyruvate kinase [Vicinamibacteria bacterium]
MKTSLSPSALKGPLGRLRRANAAFARKYPGDSPERQPVHTVYGGAQLFAADSTRKLGALALRALREHAPDPDVFGTALGLPRELAVRVHARVVAKLEREPVEDFRIDFEDGYGNRPDAEEDEDAERTAEEVAKGHAAGSLPPFIGIRIKPLSGELYARSLRTLDIFVTTLAARTKGMLPSHFAVTIPKVTIPEHVSVVADLALVLEKKTRLTPGSLRLEVMVETPQSVLGEDGASSLRAWVAAGKGRVRGAHFGTYDYTASCNITAAYQGMTHPACDFARHVMQVALAGSGVALSDGATNIMPVAPHRAGPGGAELTDEQRRQNRAAVHGAWKLHFDHVRHSLRHAYYQGWDLHPAQLPTRYGAVYSFFLEGLEAASRRLKAFTEKAAQATLQGDVFDDAATGQGLLNLFLRGLGCGAITPEEAAATGLSLEEMQTRSFLKILERRRRRG